MAYKSSYELHHHFPKVAEEAGFTFNTHRPRSHIDWNKIRLIDIENIIRERRFVIIEQHLSDILNCVLESEFDVRILDEGVLKVFRLAQLAVEYQQFCRHYLDRSVVVLREELHSLAQDLNATKKNLQDREEEIKRLRKKTKMYRTPLPYGNDNIAAMILKTLANKSDMFQSTSNGDILPYNKCTYCDKTFLNQLYLRSHISRRHPNVMEVPQKDVPETVQSSLNEKESLKLNDEITELKSKLKEMETFIAKIQDQGRPEYESNTRNVNPEINHGITMNHHINSTKKTKDAEVSTNNEDYLMDKIEEWKKGETEKNNKEINLLKNQILDFINSIKDKEVKQPVVQNDSHLVEQLHSTIEQQGKEIQALKQELISSKLKSDNEETDRRRESDAQMSYWAKRAEAQSKQYETLLQKLNDVAKEAQESRASADAERERSAQLQALLHQSFSNKHDDNKDNPTNHITTPDRNSNRSVSVKRPVKKKSYNKANPVSDRKTLENLHRKAQELLNIGSTSSSDTSSGSTEKADRNKLPKNTSGHKPELKLDGVTEITQRNNKPSLKDAIKSINNLQKANLEDAKIKAQKLKKHKSKSHANIAAQEESPGFGPGSPIKVVRAKITEEVNSRLVSVGVDPLKSRLAQTVFQKQRMQLQQQHETKSKVAIEKNPNYQKVKHSILAYLDSTTSDTKKDVPEAEDYISPNKIPKAFSLTSVISNVKSKALALVKSNDLNSKVKRNTLNAEVAKRAMSLLKTPPGSAPSSPVTTRGTKPKTDSPAKELKHSSSNKILYNHEKFAKNKEKSIRKEHITTTDDSDDKSNDSDHKYYNSAIIQQPSNSVERLIKSPARRPSSATADYTGAVRKFTIDSGEPSLVRTQSAANMAKSNTEANSKKSNLASQNTDSSDEAESLRMKLKKSMSEENIIRHPKQTKGVLKNASSTSSLNKKKVLFDMEAIQMKSVSASPSQSITDKSDANENFELGLVNLDGDEWDISSSIENEPLKNDTRIQINSRTSPKIAELKQTIEAQLARRNETPPTALVGGVDVLAGPAGRAASVAGSNTSLGSSILDESEAIPVVNNKAFVKPRKLAEKYDSELDISEYSIDGLTNQKGNGSF